MTRGTGLLPCLIALAILVTKLDSLNDRKPQTSADIGVDALWLSGLVPTLNAKPAILCRATT
ncbi:MAG: hypothetical protein AB1714_24470 [Acidobacteriota bacterium]